MKYLKLQHFIMLCLITILLNPYFNLKININSILKKTQIVPPPSVCTQPKRGQVSVLIALLIKWMQIFTQPNNL